MMAAFVRLPDLHYSALSHPMTPTEITQTIARLRREMPRNQTAMDLCAACEQLMVKAQPKRQPLTRAEIQRNYRRRQKEKK